MGQKGAKTVAKLEEGGKTVPECNFSKTHSPSHRMDQRAKKDKHKCWVIPRAREGGSGKPIENTSRSMGQ